MGAVTFEIVVALGRIIGPSQEGFFVPIGALNKLAAGDGMPRWPVVGRELFSVDE